MTRKAHIRLPVKHILLAQAGVTILMSLALGFYGRVAAYSAFTGGMICVIANAYAAWRTFAPTAADSAEGVLSNLYRAEVGKFAIVTAFFIAVFAGWESVNIGAFLAGSIAVIMVGVIAPAFRNVDEKIPGQGAKGTRTDGE